MRTPEIRVAIPKEQALQLCAEIRNEFQGKWWTLAGWQCWGCSTFSRGDLTKRCVASQVDYRGCNLVNARYDKMAAPANKREVGGI